ncbi:MAG: dihydrofolate reductase [Saprospiraceae bacterium]|nr:dihydrofolate reductase [Saprospiraceae bacterium]
MDRKLILYIAMSLDGYIAGPDDNLDFLSCVQIPGEDYGYSKFNSQVDTLIWGRKTYDKMLSFGIDFPHKDKKCYVLSKSRSGQDENVEYYGGELTNLIKRLKEEDGKHIYCDGGGEIVSALLQANLIDQLIISVIPYLLGSGARLFHEGRPEAALSFLNSTTYPSGLVQLCYVRKLETAI